MTLYGLPGVEFSQIQTGSGVGNLYHPVLDMDLLRIHSAGQASLPANHELTSRHVDPVPRTEQKPSWRTSLTRIHIYTE